MELDVWLEKIKQARSHSEVFAILDEFRTHEWTDVQLSKTAKLYMRILENLGPPTAADNDLQAVAANSNATAVAAAEKGGASADGATAPAAPVPAPVNDGPVWYEKM